MRALRALLLLIVGIVLMPLRVAATIPPLAYDAAAGPSATTRTGGTTLARWGRRTTVEYGYDEALDDYDGSPGAPKRVRGEAEAIPFTTLATVFAAKGGGYSSGKPPHTADVTVNRGGKTVVSETVESGNMTAEEKALGFPQGQNASHTEARAVRNIPLQAGDTMNINGEYAPCPSCRGAMNQAAGASGARIIYSWPGGVFVAGGE